MNFDTYNFWEVIEKMNWRNLCKKDFHESYTIANENLKKCTDNNDMWILCIKETAKAYRTILTEKLREYSLKKYGNRYMFPAIGDDSLWDLTAHIVGCGKDIYEEVMTHPATIETYLNEYVENFEYSFNK